MSDDEMIPTGFGKLTIGEGAILLTIKCPLCGKKHIHGWGCDDGYRASHRCAHCSTTPPGHSKGYFIAPLPGEVEKLVGKVAAPVTADDVLIERAFTIYVRTGDSPRVVADYTVDSVWPTGLVVCKGGRRFNPFFLRTNSFADRERAIASIGVRP